MEKQLKELKELKAKFEMMSFMMPFAELRKDFKEGAEIMENLISAIEDESLEKYADCSDKFAIYMFNLSEKYHELLPEETTKRLVETLPAFMKSTQTLKTLIDLRK